jgi:hypothetical protein
MNDKPALSISQLDMLSRCGEQYRRRYIEHERLAPGVALDLNPRDFFDFQHFMSTLAATFFTCPNP